MGAHARGVGQAAAGQSKRPGAVAAAAAAEAAVGGGGGAVGWGEEAMVSHRRCHLELRQVDFDRVNCERQLLPRLEDGDDLRAARRAWARGRVKGRVGAMDGGQRDGVGESWTAAGACARSTSRCTSSSFFLLPVAKWIVAGVGCCACAADAMLPRPRRCPLRRAKCLGLCRRWVLAARSQRSRTTGAMLLREQRDSNMNGARDRLEPRSRLARLIGAEYVLERDWGGAPIACTL